MSWFSVRTIYMNGDLDNGHAVYHERILLFRADTGEKAFEMAEAESARYREVNPTFRRVGHPVAFVLGAKVDDLDGVTVWDVPGHSELGPDEFLKKYYTDVEYQPEDFEVEDDEAGPAA